MSLALDTSVVVRLLTGQPTAQAEQARALLTRATDGVTVSDLVVGEVYFALRHHYAVPHGEAVRALAGFLHDPKVVSSGVARSVLANPEVAKVAKSFPGFMDRLILADYVRDDLALVTFDRVLGRQDGAQLLG